MPFVGLAPFRLWSQLISHTWFREAYRRLKIPGVTVEFTLFGHKQTHYSQNDTPIWYYKHSLITLPFTSVTLIFHCTKQLWKVVANFMAMVATSSSLYCHQLKASQSICTLLRTQCSIHLLPYALALVIKALHFETRSGSEVSKNTTIVNFKSLFNKYLSAVTLYLFLILPPIFLYCLFQ